MGTRILTTHVGSLPRPADIIPLLVAQDRGAAVDEAHLDSLVAAAVDDVVARQIAAGVDVVSDGEMSKMSYTNYLRHRIAGFDGQGRALSGAGDLVANPEFAEHMRRQAEENPLKPPACNGALRIKSRVPLERDLAHLKTAVDSRKPHRAFLSAASPGVVSLFMENQHYPSTDAYLAALVDVLREEYEAIAAAGFDVQLDAPDLAMGRHTGYRQLSDKDFLAACARNVEAINAATRNIPAERLRLHLCWGNYPGPHTHDVPVADVLEIVLQARPQHLLFEAANPRHAHEHEVFAAKRHLIPDDKILVPGVIDTNTNCVEHPDLIRQRLLAFGRIVGLERVMAGTDCGFSTVASRPRVFPTLVWQKLAAMREGADRAAISP